MIHTKTSLYHAVVFLSAAAETHAQGHAGSEILNGSKGSKDSIQIDVWKKYKLKGRLDLKWKLSPAFVSSRAPVITRWRLGRLKLCFYLVPGVAGDGLAHVAGASSTHAELTRLRIVSASRSNSNTLSVTCAAKHGSMHVPRRVAHLGDNIAVAADGRRRCCARTTRESLNKGWFSRWRFAVGGDHLARYPPVGRPTRASVMAATN